jgi:hypothetical protein
MSQASFVDAVVNDGRSYSPELMDKVLLVLSSRMLTEAGTVDGFRALAAHLQAAHATMLAEDSDLGDIPDDFLGIARLLRPTRMH